MILGWGLSGAATLTGTVVGNADGDTITILDGDHHQHKIRLAGIDAPEKRPLAPPWRPLDNCTPQRLE